MKARPLVPPVPCAVRLVLTIGLLLGAGGLVAIADGIAALAAWISPEVRDR